MDILRAMGARHPDGGIDLENPQGGDLTMPSEMVERVARAICMAEHIAADCGWSEQEAFDFANDHWSGYVRESQSAIVAMRETTEAMIEASNREWDGRMSHRSSGAWQ